MLLLDDVELELLLEIRLLELELLVEDELVLLLSLLELIMLDA